MKCTVLAIICFVLCFALVPLYAPLAQTSAEKGDKKGSEVAGGGSEADVRPKGLSVSGAIQYYVIEKQPFKTSVPGLRFGADFALPAGYGSVLLGAEFGLTYTFAGSTEPGYYTVDDKLWFFPLAAKFSYAVPVGKTGFFVTPALCLGGGISRIGNLTGISPLVGARIYADYGLTKKLRVYCGGSLDALFETDGAFVLPVIEAGLRIKLL